MMGSHNFQRLGDAAEEIVQKLRRQLLVQRLHRLGDRALYEMMEELRELLPPLYRGDIDDILDQHAAIDPDILRVLGVDQIPPPPLHIVGGE